MILKKLNVFIAFGLLLFAASVGVFSEESMEESFLDKEMEWREQRDKQMRSSSSWLTIAGLFWLAEGENRFGSGETCEVKLPLNSAPENLGMFILRKDNVFLSVLPGEEVRVNGKTVSEFRLKGDDRGKPDIVEIGNLRMWVIKRGDRYAVRLRDLDHLPFKEYQGLDFFPPDALYRIEADFFPYKTLKTIKVPTMIGTLTEMTSIGVVRFNLNEQEFELVALGESLRPDSMFFIFKDLTNGKETYEASRFMAAGVLENGKVDLNFNRAYNPPCAYTPFATCPLPPEKNHLKVRIEAGEKKYAGHEHEVIQDKN